MLSPDKNDVFSYQFKEDDSPIGDPNFRDTYTNSIVVASKHSFIPSLEDRQKVLKREDVTAVINALVDRELRTLRKNHDTFIENDLNISALNCKYAIQLMLALVDIKRNFFHELAENIQRELQDGQVIKNSFSPFMSK